MLLSKSPLSDILLIVSVCDMTFVVHFHINTRTRVNFSPQILFLKMFIMVKILKQMLSFIQHKLSHFFVDLQDLGDAGDRFHRPTTNDTAWKLDDLNCNRFIFEVD